MKESINYPHYCDDCMHQKVCKYESKVREYESSSPGYDIGIGPKFMKSVECPHKIYILSDNKNSQDTGITYKYYSNNKDASP